MGSARIHVGTSGWSYPDWLGIVYPAEVQREHRKLAYLAQYFDCVEINNTFYRPPVASFCRKWLRDVRHNPNFSFTLKLWQRFTHEREQPWEEHDVLTFREGIAPLAEANRLGAILAQFPWSFTRTPENQDWLMRIANAFGEFPLAVEVRHISWQHEEVLELFRRHRLAWCNIDQPATRSSIGATNIATSATAYYRFHGRNREKWFARDAGRDARYDYLYSEKELAPWIKNISEMAERVENIYVMANNHYRGQAPTNALQMKAALSGEKVPVPPLLAERFPILKDIALLSFDSARGPQPACEPWRVEGAGEMRGTFPRSARPL